MLENIFASSVRGLARVRTLRTAPNGFLLDSFSRELLHSRYANSTARQIIRAAEHLLHLAARRHIPLRDWKRVLPPAFSRYLSGRNGSRGYRGCYRYRDTKSLKSGAHLFLEHLQKTGVITAPVDQSVVPLPLIAFRRWMTEQRGTGDATLENYDRYLRKFLDRYGEDPRHFTAQGMRRFYLESAQNRGAGPRKISATALRLFIRFLIAEGKCAAGLEGAIPVLPAWRLSELPRYFQPAEVERIVGSCNLASPAGLRDRAILLLLARLGLRAGDVARLRLGDIDWSEACVVVSGKGRRQSRLPLTQEVGDAIVAYLKFSRPPTDLDFLFVGCHAPFRPLPSHCAVSQIVGYAIRRAGVKRPSRGAAHLLRHSVATSLLRHGASLQDIGAILRHRSIQSTQIYAKVDVRSLDQIAQPWPAVQS
jgi:integrase/recombinase XerD